MGTVIDMQNRHVNHDLCRECDHDDHCHRVCAAVETLAQLCKVKDDALKLEYLNNISDQLDLENSYNGMPDVQ